LPEVLATRSAEVAEAVADAVARHIVPSSPWLGAQHQRGERAAERTHMVQRLLALAATGEPLTDEDFRFYEDIGTLFARHAVPLGVLMAAFDVGTTAIAGESWRIASAGHFTEMARFTDSAARMMAQAQQASIRAYLEAGRTGNDPRPVRWVLAEALVAGESVLAAAQAAGEKLAPGYLVMACAVASAAEADVLRRPEVSRAVESVPGTLYCGDQSRLVVFLPVRASRRQADAAAAELASRLCALAGQPVYAGLAFQPGLDSVPAALDEARATLRLVMAIPDADSRPYRMDDLLVELAIERQPEIRQRLTALLSPLEGGTDLRHTLEVLLASNLDRERTARELCIHRRTLRYRVDRIKDLSGINPDTVHGLQLLRAALTAARLPATEPGWNCLRADALVGHAGDIRALDRARNGGGGLG
jgi:hypothetical protein